MKSSCYFIFNHSVLHCSNPYSINLHNSRSILILVLSTVEPSWILHFAPFVWFHYYYFSLWRTQNSKLRTLSLTYIAREQTSTNSKHISRALYPLLLCDITAHAQRTDMQETCHVTTTYCWRVMSPLLRQLPHTQKTQLALLVWACIVFIELLPGNTLIKYATISCDRDLRFTPAACFMLILA
jgi:hypothetical protein